MLYQSINLSLPHPHYATQQQVQLSSAYINVNLWDSPRISLSD